MSSGSWSALRCPYCKRSISHVAWGWHQPIESQLTCNGCGVSFTSYCGIVDLRITAGATCWTEARTIPEQSLVHRLLGMFRSATLDELIDEYVKAHSLPWQLLDQTREYMKTADKREEWPLRYFEFCAIRYAGHGLRGQLALDAGCGSGGVLPHLAARFRHVVGLDVDLPALILAAKRCLERGVFERVTLVAAMLEQQVLVSDTFDAIKSTDVIEHVSDPSRACLNMVDALRPGGTLFLLTPNKWNLLSSEPHVRLWGVQLLPGRIADSYVRWRIGVPYRSVASLLSYFQLLRILGTVAGVEAVETVFIPVEDKHLNPESRRGRILKSTFQSAPLSWISRTLRLVQPTFDVLCVKGDIRAPRRSDGIPTWAC
jgi:2-polyprenyl-3-methyl-5-hydroxy-6-metoxy-1,4-benzoquinol methylase